MSSSLLTGTDREMVIFWRLPDGTRCSVLEHAPGLWRLVVRQGSRQLFQEDFADRRDVLRRAGELRTLRR